MRVRSIPRSIPSRDGSALAGRQTRVTNVRPEVLTYRAHWLTGGEAIEIDFSDVVTFRFITRDEDFHGSPLTPSEIAASPSDQLVTDGQVLTFEQKFTCVSPGRFFVWFRGNLSQPGIVSTFVGADAISRTTTTRTAYARVAITGECIAPPASTSTPTPGVALPTTGVAPSATALTTGPDAIPTVVLPPAIGIATPAAPAGTGSDLPGFIRVYAYAGVFYYGETLVATPAHEGSCGYAHLHGGPILAVPVAGVSAPPLSEMYGACGFGPTSALFWIPEPE
ncbi:MAG: hypothetical protein DWG80_05520 [Chloroflexi bacterium]|nr:hypothetical protein [Chloroflexota bacterium]